MILLSYTNANGETIILDDTEKTFLGELYGREGTEAPELDYTELEYADGTTKVVAIRMKPRKVTFYFWAPTGRPNLRENLERIKQRMIQSGSRDDDWGSLMIRRPDNRPLYLNCVYTGGLDDFIREYPRVIKFSLTFRAEDPLFYDGFEQTYTIKQDDRSGYLFMDPDLYMGDTLYMRAAESNTGSDLFLTGEKSYPTITINGPAENIALTNGVTGRKIELSSDVSLDMNEKIIIQTQPRKRKITKTDKYGVTTNLMKKLTEDSSLNWWLVRGANEIQFENSATTPESYLRFAYKEGFLSAE